MATRGGAKRGGGGGATAAAPPRKGARKAKKGASPEAVLNQRLEEQREKRNIAFMERLAEVTANLSSMRANFLKEMLSSRRDIEAECDYPKAPSPQFYQQMFDREPIAARAVKLFPKECWQVTPTLYEDDGASNRPPTELEYAWEALGSKLRPEGKSWHKEEKGSVLWDYLRRLDEQSGIGHYGILFIGFDDVKVSVLPQTAHDHPLGPQPMEAGPYEAEDLDHTGEVPGEGGFVPSGARRTWADPVDASSPRQVNFLRVFPEALAPVASWETNQASPRFGHPLTYSVTFNSPDAGQSSGIGLVTGTAQVHWTRVIHVAENLGASDVLAIPRMQPVLNRLLDLRKISAASAEGYWQNAFPILSLETHPELAGEVNIDRPQIRDMMEQIREGLQRELVLSGMSAKTLPPSCLDPTPWIAAAIESVCIEFGCPIRIFKGSERGELASTQDDDSWNDRVKARQEGFVTPRIIVPLADRLIAYGALPMPTELAGGYKVWWPDVTSSSAAQKATIMLQKTQAIVSYSGSDAPTYISPLDFWTRIMGETEEDAMAIVEAAAMGGAGADGLPPGGMADEPMVPGFDGDTGGGPDDDGSGSAWDDSGSAITQDGEMSYAGAG